MNKKIIIIVSISIPIMIFGFTLNTNFDFPPRINADEEKKPQNYVDDEDYTQDGDINPSMDDKNQLDDKKSEYLLSSNPELYDDFESGPYHLGSGTLSPNGKWIGMWNGGGSLDVKKDPFDESNYVLVVESGFIPNETRSGLVLTTSEYDDFVLSLDVRNDRQLREPEPNSWEVGWIFWRYVDNTHFNYFTLKPNGSESGKYDGGVNPEDQLFIKMTEFPNTSIGKWDHLDIIVKGNHVIVAVNGIIAQEFDDVSSFDKGKIGLYNEDAYVSFDNIFITPI